MVKPRTPKGNSFITQMLTSLETDLHHRYGTGCPTTIVAMAGEVVDIGEAATVARKLMLQFLLSLSPSCSRGSRQCGGPDPS